jgi:Leucine-rich repeat (LRR) protein
VRDVVNDDTAIKIASIGAHLLQLDIIGNGVSDIDMTKIVEDCRNMEILNISECQSITDIGFSRIAECCPNLTILYMSG